MTARIVIIFLVLASLFVLPCAAQENEGKAAADFSSLRMTGTAEVRAVIDPLTMQMTDGKIVRLSGLDIPDFDPYSPGDITIAATAELRKLFEGKSVHLYQTMNSDKGRTNRMGYELAQVESADGKVWAQEDLLSEGLARVRTTESNPEMAQAMYGAEQTARKAETGLWSLTGFPVLTPDMTQTRIGSFQIVEGRVQNAAVVNNRIYLNFGDDWRTDFTVGIDPDARRLFARAGLDPLQWGGKVIRARGWLESYNGPFMKIDHPEAVEFPADSVEENGISPLQ